MPKPSTPALLPTIVRPFAPLSRNATIRFSGMPQRPKPPAAIVMPSWSRPASAASALGKTLLMSGDDFHARGEAFAAADADGGDTALEPALPQRGEQRDENARAGAADGMTERDRAAAHV